MGERVRTRKLVPGPGAGFCDGCGREGRRRYPVTSEGMRQSHCGACVELPGHKYCSKCDRVLPLECFGRNRATASGLTAWCAECKRDWERAWAAAHPERLRAIRRNFSARRRSRKGRVAA